MQKSRNQWDNNFSKRQEKNIFGPLNSGNGIEKNRKLLPFFPCPSPACGRKAPPPPPKRGKGAVSIFT
jgi:hypothetical protein